MSDAAVSNILTNHGPLWFIVVSIALMAAQAFFGARGKSSGYSPRDEKHDANQGEMREIKTMLEANGRNRERELAEHQEWLEDQLDDIKDALRRMETIGEVLKDRQTRS